METPTAKVSNPSQNNLTLSGTEGDINRSERRLSNSSHSTPSTPSTLPHRCQKCGRGYATRSGLSKHNKEKPNCNLEDRKVCNYCDSKFESFPAVRLHERKSHFAQYSQDEEKKLPAPAADLLVKMATIEAETPARKPFLDRMVEATGLTKDQVRHRREKKEYKTILEQTKKNLSALAKSKFNQLKPSEPKNSPKATILSNIILTAAASRKFVSKPMGQTTPLSHTVTRSTENPRIDNHSYQEPGPSTSTRNSLEVSFNRTKNDSTYLSATESQPGSDVEQDGGGRSVYGSPETPLPTAGLKRARNDNSSFEETPEVQLSKRIAIRNPMDTVMTVNIQVDQPSTENYDRNNMSAIPSEVENFPPSNIENSPPQIIDYIRGVALELLEDAQADSLNKQLINITLTGSREEFTTYVDQWIQKKIGGKKNNPIGTNNNNNNNAGNRTNNANSNCRNYGQQNTGRGPRASNYKKAQDLYTKNRASLADIILNGRSLYDTDAIPDLRATERLYGGILGSESPPDDEPLGNHVTDDHAMLSRPISLEEVSNAKKSWANSAAGLDGIQVSSVRNHSNFELCVLFNTLLARGVVPTTWLNSRTTLVPKEGDRTDPSNWRPITVTSALMRLMHRILATRLSGACDLHPSQRGFVNIDGTLANALILDQYIKHRSAARKPYNVLSLDIRKAFDTVSHHSVRRALKAHGVPQYLIDFIMFGLTNSTAKIKVGEQFTNNIAFKRGVKQGDPLSSILFNLVLNEILENLNSDPTKGGSLDRESTVKCRAMAFADDLILLEDSDSALPITLHEVSEFFKRRGMTINTAKSSLLSAALVPGGGKVIVRTKPFLKHEGKFIKQVNATDPFKYLGHKFGATGVCKPNISNLHTWLYNLSRSPLKPDQKLVMLKQYLIPKILFGLQNSKVTGKILRDADRVIKHFVKTSIHLSIHTPDASLYARVRDGGLGITELRHSIPKILLSRMMNLLAFEHDTALSFVMQSDEIRVVFRRVESLAGGVVPAQHWREKLIACPMLTGLEAANEDPASRSWIDNKPAGWTGRDFVRAVQLRTNNLPTSGLIYNDPNLRKCRGRCDKIETLCHVLQQCPVTHWERIKRHNEIAKKLASHCRSKGWKVEEEPHIRHPSGQLFKPDLAIHQASNIIICDAQVRWEGETSLGSNHAAKRAYYEANPLFIEAAQTRWPNKILIFEPLTVGARGIWSKCNDPTVAILKIPNALRASMVHSALKWGSTIHATFGRSVWRGQRNRGARR